MNERTSKELMGLILRALHRDADLNAYVRTLCDQGIVPTMNINVGFTVRQPQSEPFDPAPPDPAFDQKFLKSLRITVD